MNSHQLLVKITKLHEEKTNLLKNKTNPEDHKYLVKLILEEISHCHKQLAELMK